MDNDQNLFSLTVDPVTKAHLYETAKWARFLAILGFVFLGLMVIGGIFASFMLSSSMGTMETEFDSTFSNGFSFYRWNDLFLYYYGCAHVFPFVIFIPFCSKSKIFN
jgi:hypothetical protein